MIEDKVYNLGLWDTAGQEEYDKMRTVSYPHTDVFVLCFSLVHPMSFDNVRNRWFPELKEYCPESPILLVGTKQDLVTDEATLQALAKQGLTPTSRDLVFSFFSYSFLLHTSSLPPPVFHSFLFLCYSFPTLFPTSALPHDY
eukprot:Phypoly_transcript_14827.p1 GENE.Phypoly_transcript_14827~~Phypoly_transcript_14827.p1  ORF type:complete len:142 (+),score=8.83 Phypoly_transcript_14827:268-693(+)